MGQFYRVRTFHGSLLSENKSTGEVESVLEAHAADSSQILVCYLPEGRDDVAFLISSRGRMLRLLPTQTGNGVVALGLSRAAGSDAVSFYDADSGLWLCTVPLVGEPAQGGRVVAAVRKIDAYETYTFVPVPPVFVPASVTALAQHLDRLLVRPLDLDLILSTGPESAGALQAVGVLTAHNTLLALAKALLRSPAGCRHLATLFPQDLYATHGLPELAGWYEARDRPPPLKPMPLKPGLLGRLFRQTQLVAPEPPSFTQSIGPEFDTVAAPGLVSEHVSLAYACNALARQQIDPGRGLCIVATARNEGLSILEWLAYHRSIGVEQVFLYTNNNDDGSDELLGALAAGGALQWIRNHLGSNGNAQMKAYGHALALDPAVLDHSWALIIDLDEYLMLNPALFGSAADFVRWHDRGACDAIALNWVIYGSNGQARWHDEFVGRRFPAPAEAANRHIKTMCRPRRFIHSRPHYPQSYRGEAVTFRASNGEPHVPFGDGGWSFSAHPTAEFAWINHYFFKSAEEYLWKWSRNRGDHPLLEAPSTAVLPADFVRIFVSQFPQQNAPIPTLAASAPGFQAELAALKALPGVAEAWTRVKQIFQTRIRALTATFADAPGIVEAGEDGERFIAILNS